MGAPQLQHRIVAGRFACGAKFDSGTEGSMSMDMIAGYKGVISNVREVFSRVSPSVLTTV